jgi:hypothetical protein
MGDLGVGITSLNAGLAKLYMGSKVDVSLPDRFASL